MVKAVLLDLDGTVYKGNELIPGADEAIRNMKEKGVHVFYSTNNSSKLPSSIAGKLNGMGIQCDEEDVISSGFMAVWYVRKNGLKGVHVFGTDELRQGFINAGVELSDEDDFETLVIGMDMGYDYARMTLGMRLAFRAKTIILCNEDPWFEKEDGIYPGCGGITASILHCSERKPDVIVGKPNTFMVEYVAEKYGFSKGDMVVIGDSLCSDVAMAERYGCRYYLINSEMIGDEVISSLAEITEWDWASL